MELVKVESLVGKETKEVFELVAELIKDVKAKKDWATIGAENLPLLLKAIEGVSALPEEVKSKAVGATVGYGVGLVTDALLA